MVQVETVLSCLTRPATTPEQTSVSPITKQDPALQASYSTGQTAELAACQPAILLPTTAKLVSWETLPARTYFNTSSSLSPTIKEV